jgi:hypothetical protein
MSRENIFERVERLVDLAVDILRSGRTMEDFPEELKETFARWEMAYSTQMQYYHKGKSFVHNVYRIAVKQKWGVISDKQIREDLYAAPLLFVRIEPINREFKRALAIERLEKSIAMAIADDDFSAQAKLEAILYKYLDAANDPEPMNDMNKMAADFNIVQTFDPKLLHLEDVSWEYIDSFRNQMLNRTKLIQQNIEEGNTEPLEKMEDIDNGQE